MTMDELKLWKLIKPIFFYDENGEPYYPYIKTNFSSTKKMFDIKYHLLEG